MGLNANRVGRPWETSLDYMSLIPNGFIHRRQEKILPPTWPTCTFSSYDVEDFDLKESPSYQGM